MTLFQDWAGAGEFSLTTVGTNIVLLSITDRYNILICEPLAHPKEISRVQDADSASERIKELGGAGLYPVDLIVSCNVSDLKRVEPFPTPFVTFSYDLETSVKHNTILCAAAVIDRSGERTTHEFIGSEKEIMEGLTRLVRDEDPDFITGYNIDNFDLPRTLERSEENSNSFSEQSSQH